MDWVNENSVIQVLLDAEADISNAIYRDSTLTESLGPTRSMLHRQIEVLRDTLPPVCYGEDDCSTLILSRCPWRMTCGS
jgi:hypothetical protein